MTWATPMLAGLVAAIAIPALVILYFLKLRRTPREVSTTLLWKQAIQDIQANAPFQKLRKNILLFLQLIILALILIALAQPRSTSTSAVGQKIVILFDRSASMQARDAGSESNPITRFEHAKAHAIDLIESLASPSLFEESARADEAMIIAFGSSAEIVENFTSDKSKLIAAIQAIQPTDAPSSIEEAFRLAQAQRPNRPAQTEDSPSEDSAAAGDPDNISAPPADPITYHLFSDGRIPDLSKIRTDPSSGPAPAFEYHAIGSPTSVNLGIVSLQAERDYEKPTKLSIFVGVQSTDPQQRSVDAELVVSGATIAVRSIKLPPAVTDPATNITEPSVGGVVFELDEPRALTATVRLAGLDDPSADALDRDNASTVIIPPAARARVALVTSGSVFLTRAIDVLPIADFRVLTPSRYESIRNTDEAAAIDLFILDGYTPEPNAQGDRLDPGRYLVLGDIPRGDQPVTDEGAGTTTQIINWRRTHPLLRGLTLDAVIVGEPRKLALPRDSELVSLAETPVGPAIIEESTPDTRAVYVTFKPQESNWPLEPSFIVFLGSAVDYLASTDASTVDTDARQLEPGSILADRLPLDATNIRVRLPDSTYSEDLVPSPDGRIVYGPITTIGRYQLQWTGSAGATDATQGNLNTRDYAANLLDAPESNTGTQTTIALSNAVVSADATGQIERLKEWWPYLLAAALAVMLLEWWVYNRKVYF